MHEHTSLLQCSVFSDTYSQCGQRHKDALYTCPRGEQTKLCAPIVHQVKLYIMPSPQQLPLSGMGSIKGIKS